MPARTELFIRARLRADIPDDVQELLRVLLGGTHDLPALPDHPFFRVAEFHKTFNQVSTQTLADHHFMALLGRTRSHGGTMLMHSQFINDNDLLALFMDWLTPHLIVGQGFIGYSLFEQHDKPQLYFV